MKLQFIILIASLSIGPLLANEPQVPTEQRNQIEKAIVEASMSVVLQKKKVEALEIELEKEKHALNQLEETLEADIAKLKVWNDNSHNNTTNRIEEEPAQQEHVLTIRASGNVYVLVKDRTTNVELLRDTLSENDNITLKPKNEVDVMFTAGENLIFEWDGKEVKPERSGTAKITLK
ncbi:hypothetical protein QEH52_11100 [Coraliomargarita sp. SDUM461003]|uniref:Uncharacterized protein n=1 Tax=Thalassobacterium maritimum TaxID=3041265 RepID=A0ABU1AV95_9BACT|nr:hypothetical protein [Coraliomargarita sp. SDUM461003]MDQ8208058.1 hypothetical protein [Coraliomargarita sp. SDUM461003]